MSGLNFWEIADQNEVSEHSSSEEEEEVKPSKNQQQAPVPYSR